MGKPGSDRKPDGRGMAIKLRGIGGASLLSLVPGGADLPGVRVGEQDFLLTNYPVFFGKNVADYSRFMNILKPTRSRWQGVLKLGQLFTFIVLGGRWHQLGIFVRQALRRTDSPLHESYFSMTPYLMGEDTVVRYVATPSPGSVGVGANALAPSRSPSFLREAMVAELESEGGRDGDHSFAAAFDFAAQVRHTPTPEDVEDASRAWADIRDVTVPLARIEIPWQVFTGAECQFDCENLSFNPWHSLPQHRPLGGLNRMRLAVYLASAQLRHRLNMLDAI